MSRQQFDTTDVLRLQVGLPHATMPNLFENTHGELGGWGWITQKPNTTVTGVVVGVGPATRLHYTTGSLSAPTVMNFWTEPIPCTPGLYAGGRFNLAVGNGCTVNARFEFVNAAGAIISTSAPGATVSFGTVSAPVTLIPAGAVFVRFRIDVFRTVTGTRTIEFSFVMVSQGTQANMNVLTYKEPVDTWVDILGPSHDVNVKRSGLQTGRLTAKLNDVTLDPSQAATIRPGRHLRLQTLDDAAVWQPLFTGRVLEADVTYDLLHPNANKRARITLVGIDNSQRMANQARPSGTNQIAGLRWLLEGAGVPWLVEGNSGQLPSSPTWVPSNPNASLLDQIALIRDSNLAYAWVDRRNVAVIQSTPGAFAGTVGPAHYSNLDRSFSTKDCINEAVIKCLEIDPADSGKTVEVKYGPYRNENSIREWGVYSSEFTVQGLTPAQIATLGADILAANSIPAIRTNSITLPIRAIPVPPAVITPTLDLYQLLDVDHDTGTDSLKITSIEHKITPKRWDLVLGFAGEDTVPGPTQQPALPSTGPGSLDVDNLALAAAGAFTSSSTLTRRGPDVDIYWNVTSTGAVGGGVLSIVIPAAHLPIDTKTKYFAAVDSASGNLVSCFMSGGGIGRVFAIGGAGTATIGHIHYLAQG